MPEGLTIQMRVCRPFMGPVKRLIMAEVLPTPMGPEDNETTLRLRIDATRLGDLELSVFHVLHCLPYYNAAKILLERN